MARLIGTEAAADSKRKENRIAYLIFALGNSELEERIMSRRRLPGEGDVIRLPQPPPPDVAADAFIPCPFCASPTADPVQWLCQQALYQWAMQQAQAVARPSLPERDLAGVWN